LAAFSRPKHKIRQCGKHSRQRPKIFPAEQSKELLARSVPLLKYDEYVANTRKLCRICKAPEHSSVKIAASAAFPGRHYIGWIN
jgi:hypothetical protein